MVSRGGFGAYNKHVSQLKYTSLTALARAADISFRAAMTAVCPSDPTAAWFARLESRKFCEEWCPENADVISKTPLCRGLVAAYHNAGSREAKVAILSLFSPHFKYGLTESLFNVDHNEVYASRLHAAKGHAGVQLERLKHQRFCWDPQKFSFLHQWLRSDFASTDSDGGNGKRLRSDIRARLYDEYQTHFRLTFQGEEPASASQFYIEMGGDAFMDQTSESCCCGQCMEGWTHLNMMKDFIMEPNNGLDDAKALTCKVDEIKKFLAYDYRWKHLTDSSEISTHCCNYALASPEGCYTNSCAHDHNNTCVECSMWPV